MHRRRSSRAAALLVALAFVASAPLSGALITVEAQQPLDVARGALSAVEAQPAAAKRPLTYDTYDYWRAIEGTELSRDGVWLAYALTSEAEDGELVVRNLNTKQEFRHPRGTSPSFTPDGRFVVFTVQALKAEVEKATKVAGKAK